jgi:hypothetical protein
MDARTKGAWLLSHSKTLDHVAGPGSLRLEKVAYAGKIGRLYNVLRRGSDAAQATQIGEITVANLCQLNNIDLASRRNGLHVLKKLGRIDVSEDGSVEVLGATTGAVLETTAEIFETAGPSRDEHAALMLSNEAAARPIGRTDAVERIGDAFKISATNASDLVDLCKNTALIDEEKDRADRSFSILTPSAIKNGRQKHTQSFRK